MFFPSDAYAAGLENILREPLSSEGLQKDEPCKSLGKNYQDRRQGWPQWFCEIS